MRNCSFLLKTEPCSSHWKSEFFGARSFCYALHCSWNEILVPARGEIRCLYYVSVKKIFSSWNRSSVLIFYLIIKLEEGQVAELPFCIVIVTLMNFRMSSSVLIKIWALMEHQLVNPVLLLEVTCRTA